jgi:hypothetical protein
MSFRPGTAENSGISALRRCCLSRLLLWLRWLPFRCGHFLFPFQAKESPQFPGRFNRQANHALWRIAFVRLSSDPTTKAYAARRTAEGKSQREIIRCLKRYIAREIYRLIVEPVTVRAGADLRSIRLSRGFSLAVVAAELGTSMNTISRLG